MTRWRKRIGSKNMEQLLSETPETAKRERLLTERHMKHGKRMDRNYLKGTDGDKMNIVLAACGFNLRKLLRAIL